MVPPPFQTAHQHLEDNQSHAMSGECEKIHPWTESFSWKNTCGIRQQQHVHCHRTIHTQNACHSIPRGKTQRHFYNSPHLTLTETNVDNAVTASTRLQTQGRTCAVYG